MTKPKHTDTSRSGDLVERLRKARVWPDYSQSRVTIETAHEAADRIEAFEAEIERLRNAMVVMDNTVRELTEALREMFEAVCGETGFAQAVRAESGIAYPWPALDLAEAMARAALKENTDASSD